MGDMQLTSKLGVYLPDVSKDINSQKTPKYDHPLQIGDKTVFIDKEAAAALHDLIGPTPGQPGAYTMDPAMADMIHVNKI